MKSNYRRLGEYIHEVNLRNQELIDMTLLGVSIQKVFMPSIANIIGTDMSTYKIIKRGQFAYGPVTSRNGDKISVALLDEFDEAIISQAYTSFEIKDTNKLLPEYLMMWFRRAEFDRYARFMSHGSAREIFSWEDMCNVELPVPSIGKQKEIYKEYQTVVDRISLNNNLLNKLEETATTLYKQWFVDFEFPDENGQPYKSSGGEMIACDETEIPEHWTIKSLDDICVIHDKLRKPLSEIERIEIKGKYPYYGAMSIVDYIDKYIFDGVYILFSEDGVNVIDEFGHPAVQYIWGKFWVNNHAHVLSGKGLVSNEFIYLALKNSNVSHLVTGAAQPKINQENMKSISILIPNDYVLTKFNELITGIFKYYISVTENNKCIENLKNIVMSKLASVEDDI